MDDLIFSLCTAISDYAITRLRFAWMSKKFGPWEIASDPGEFLIGYRGSNFIDTPVVLGSHFYDYVRD